MLRRSIQQCHVLTTTRGLWPPPNFCRSHDLRNRLGQVKAMWSHCRPVVLVVCDASPFCLCCVCMRGVVCMCACNGGLGRAQVTRRCLLVCARRCLPACTVLYACVCVRWWLGRMGRVESMRRRCVLAWRRLAAWDGGLRTEEGDPRDPSRHQLKFVSTFVKCSTFVKWLANTSTTGNDANSGARTAGDGHLCA